MNGIPWRCENEYCLHRGRWWLSVHGVVSCLNCHPPAFPEFVRATGDAADAPLVLASCSRELADRPGPIAQDRPRTPDDALSLGKTVWIMRGDRMPEKVSADKARRKTEVPPDVTHWCCEGDPQWTPYVRPGVEASR